MLTHYRRTLEFRKRHPALLDGDMEFVGTNKDLLAFTRGKGGEKLLFVFNLTREPAEFRLPAGMMLGEPVDMPGFALAAEWVRRQAWAAGCVLLRRSLESGCGGTLDRLIAC